MPKKAPPSPGIAPPGDAHGGSPTREMPTRDGVPREWPALKAARGQGWHLRGPTGATLGRNQQEKGKGERRAGRAQAAARRLRTCGPGATREGRAGREDLEVKRWQIVKKVIVRCPIYYGFIVG